MFSFFGNQFRQRCLVLSTSLIFGFLMNALATRVTAQNNELRIVAQQSGEEPTIRLVPVQETQSGGDDSRALGVVDLNLFRPISDIRVDIRSNATSAPIDYSDKLFADYSSSNYPGSFQSRLAAWEAPNIRYQPLYFQDVSLERYGYTRGPILQPIGSAAYFGMSLISLPLNAVRDRPGTCDTPLGFCRPGSHAPYTQPRWLLQR